MRNTKTAATVKRAFLDGYRIINGIPYNPSGIKLNGIYKESNGVIYHVIHPYKSSPLIKVAQLVAFQKYGEEALKKDIVVRHLDGDSLNNLDENIAMGTQSDNMSDRNREDRLEHSIKAATNLRKFTDKEIEEMKDKHKQGWSYKMLMEHYGITSKGTMSYIINNKYKTKK